MHKEGDTIKGGFWDGAEVISVYTRAQAIEDGVLVDVSELAKEAGFRFPVAVTRRLFESVLEPNEQLKKEHGQSYNGRAWDMFSILLWEIRKGKDGQRVDFAPLFSSCRATRPRSRARCRCTP